MGGRADSLSHSFPFPVKHMGAPTALPSGQRAPVRRKSSETPLAPPPAAAGPCRRGSRAQSHPAWLTPHQGRRAPGPHLPAPTCCPGGLSALGRRVPGRRGARPPALRRRWGRAPSQAPAMSAPGGGPAPSRPARRPAPFPPRAPLRPAGPLRELRRGGPRSCQLPHGRGPPPPCAQSPGPRAGVPTHSAAAGRGAGGAGSRCSVSPLRAPGPSGLARPVLSSPFRPPPARSLPPSSSSRRGPSPAEQRPSPTRGRKAASHRGAGRLGVGLRPGRGRRGGRARAGAPAGWPRPAPAPPAPPASGPRPPGRARRDRRAGGRAGSSSLCLSVRGAMQPSGTPDLTHEVPGDPGRRRGTTSAPPNAPPTAFRDLSLAAPPLPRGLPHFHLQPHGAAEGGRSPGSRGRSPGASGPSAGRPGRAPLQGRPGSPSQRRARDP